MRPNRLPRQQPPLWRLSLLAISLVLFGASIVFQAPAASDTRPDSLLETGKDGRLPAGASAPAEIKIVSYNIRWRGGADLLQVIEHLRSDAEIGGALIIGLQEVDRNRRRTGNANTARQIADALAMNYVWAAPPSVDDEEEETGAAIFSPYPLTDVERLVLPHHGPGGRRRVAVGATVRIGDRALRVYSAHTETRMNTERKVGQWQAILDDLARHPRIERAVILGDLNTGFPGNVNAARALFTQAGFSEAVPPDLPTWRTFMLEMKLDWIWVRGLEVTGSGINRRIGLSDHWPLWTKVRLQ